MRLGLRWGLVLVLSALVLAGMTASAGQAAKVAVPVKKCNKAKKKKAKRACKKRNKTARKVFKAVKNSRYTYTNFGGPAIDATFCANGKWKVVATFSNSVVTLSGKRWKLESPGLSKNLLAADLIGPSNNIYSRVYVQRRGKKWVATDQGPTTSAPPITKRSAVKQCRKLKV